MQVAKVAFCKFRRSNTNVFYQLHASNVNGFYVIHTERKEMRCYILSTDKYITTFRRSLVPSSSSSIRVQEPHISLFLGLLCTVDGGIRLFRNSDKYLPVYIS